jgi:aminopeptidase
VTDPRYAKLARVLVEYCLDVQKGDLVLIRGGVPTAPLMVEAYREALRAGGHPMSRPAIPAATGIYYATAKKRQLEFVSPIAEFEIEHVDKLLAIRGTTNTKALTNVDPEKQTTVARAGAELRQRYQDRVAAGEIQWCVTQFPCEASAQDAEMSLEEYEDFVLRACLVHKSDPVAAWKSIRRRQAKLCRYLDEVRKIRIVKKDTDITMSVAGRKWINSDGRNNMPSGEIFTGPVEDSVEGTIAFTFPACYGGREVHDVKLTFKKGKVVKATASKGQDFLHSTLDTDEGARFVGEVAVGTNYAISRFTKNTLFDEKIGGTVHMAVGSSYPKSGGRNKSAIHWDMVADMRQGGKVYADGRIIYKDGEFTLK